MLNHRGCAAPWVVVPVKDLAFAKQRLAPILSAAQRQGFYLAMLEDVLGALERVPGLAGVMLVTRDQSAIALARRFGGMRVLEEYCNSGHSQAVAHAARTLAGEGAASMLTVPGDIPLLAVAEVDALLAAHRGPPLALTIAPARDERGSNAMLCSPPAVIEFRFGNDSFAPHLALARGRGIEPRVVKLPGIGLDIDAPDDLRRFAARESQTRAYRFLLEAGILRALQRLRACTAGADG